MLAARLRLLRLVGYIRAPDAYPFRRCGFGKTLQMKSELRVMVDRLRESRNESRFMEGEVRVGCPPRHLLPRPRGKFASRFRSRALKRLVCILGLLRVLATSMRALRSWRPIWLTSSSICFRYTLEGSGIAMTERFETQRARAETRFNFLWMLVNYPKG